MIGVSGLLIWECLKFLKELDMVGGSWDNGKTAEIILQSLETLYGLLSFIRITKNKIYMIRMMVLVKFYVSFYFYLLFIVNVLYHSFIDLFFSIHRLTFPTSF